MTNDAIIIILKGMWQTILLKYMFVCTSTCINAWGEAKSWKMQVVGIPDGRIMGDLDLHALYFSSLFLAMNIYCLHNQKEAVNLEIEKYYCGCNGREH